MTTHKQRMAMAARAERELIARSMAHSDRHRKHPNEKLGPPTPGRAKPGPFKPGSPESAIQDNLVSKPLTRDPHKKGVVWNNNGIITVSQG